MSDFDAKHFVFVHIDELTQPINGTPRVVVNSYWLLDAHHRAAFYNPLDGRGHRIRPGELGSAQTNSDRRVGDQIRARYPWCVDNRQIPVVFLPNDPRRINELLAAGAES